MVPHFEEDEGERLWQDPTSMIIEEGAAPTAPAGEPTSAAPVYKEVVVIGNGPSGIALSYFLAGNWPYYNGQGESVDEMLHYRLLSANRQVMNSSVKKRQQMQMQARVRTVSCSCINNNSDEDQNPEQLQCQYQYFSNNNNNNTTCSNKNMSSLVEQDLKMLGQGLEGRSTNPTSLLFDTLNHPRADLGLELPSLLNWSFDPTNTIDHVVIGNQSSPGGTWQTLDGSVLTISLGCWMELPQLNFREWESTQESRCCCESRATVASVAQYYSDYVRRHGLSRYFYNDSVITKVTKIQHQESEVTSLPGVNTTSTRTNSNNSGLMIPNANGFDRRHSISGSGISIDAYRNGKNMTTEVVSTSDDDTRPLWKVDGFTRSRRRSCCYTDSSITATATPFTFLTRNLVLATGSSDKSNVLNIPGEHLPFVLHSLTDLERLIASGHLNEHSDPILVVGAGLSAADAIIAAKFYSIPVVHAFRRNVDDPNLIFRQLPENMYPEYHKIYQMMRDSAGYEGYKAFAQHKLVEITENGMARIEGNSWCGDLKVSCIIICIGSHPDLSLLGPLENSIGVKPGAPIDCKTNPIAIDCSSHQSLHQPGLYAMGPLVGENFVRFLQGGALAITNHLVNLKGNNNNANVTLNNALAPTTYSNNVSRINSILPVLPIPSSQSSLSLSLLLHNNQQLQRHQSTSSPPIIINCPT